MRIIAGEFRGRRIDAPEGQGTRPMLDRVRESVFATLGNALDDAFVLDLYAGSGSLGLEALSRGARRVRFVEKARGALATLAANVAELGVIDRVEIARGDALDPGSWGEGERFGVVLFDPPYRLLDDPEERAKLLRAVDAIVAERMEPGGIFVFHAPARAMETLRFPSRRTGDLRVYGTSGVLYLRAP